ncbi:hypothetical protein ACWEVD_24690 [Nocardia thailandica]|uniref:DUF732 domain-containing protein n=1 Tax=Nocardia thailandica TaxID=257275 RepID=A0ABW6PL78_9NOCA|nr:hypothetical protein [Nocardia thailandica]
MPESPHRVRRAVVAAFAAAALVTGGVAAQAPFAAAAPEYPFDGPGAGGGKSTPQDRQAEKAEKLGGGVAEDVIDLVTGIVKCGINIATDSVGCPI